MDAVPL